MAARWVVRLIRAGVWLLAVALAGLVLTETWLRWEPDPGETDAALRARSEAYDHANHLEPHPFYEPFLPIDPVRRAALSSAVVQFSPDGFRGPSPSERGTRELAFLLGGSAAFGEGASDDAHTITGFLNATQSRYFFVNAGVIGWRSTSELMRLELELLAYRPSLIVAFDGWNDADVGWAYRGYAQDVGMPLTEPLEAHRAFSAGRRWPAWRIGPWSIWGAVVPRIEETLTNRYSDRLGLPPFSPDADARLAIQVRRYLDNLTVMHDLLRARRVAFLSVFQPAAPLHARLDPRSDVWRMPTIEPMHARVVTAEKAYAWLDLGTVFDDMFDVLRVPGPQRDDTCAFWDPVHLCDRGNQIVAERIAARVAALDAAGWPGLPSGPR